jgi:hypothetical protein
MIGVSDGQSDDVSNAAAWLRFTSLMVSFPHFHLMRAILILALASPVIAQRCDTCPRTSSGRIRRSPAARRAFQARWLSARNKSLTYGVSREQAYTHLRTFRRCGQGRCFFRNSQVRSATARSEPFSYDANFFRRNRNWQDTNAMIPKPRKTMAAVAEADITVARKCNVRHPYRFALFKPFAKAVVFVELAVPWTADTWSDVVSPIFLPGTV